MRCVLAFVMSLACVQANAASVEVMSVRELSGGRDAIGEAIRETVTGDLREVGALSVIELHARPAVQQAKACVARPGIAPRARADALVTSFRSNWAIAADTAARVALDELQKVDPVQRRPWRQLAETLPREEWCS